MASVWLGRYSDWLTRLLNSKGGPLLVDVDPSLRAVAAVQEGNEDRYLQGWNRFGFALGVSAVAANFPTFQIRNPAGSNIVAVVESLTFFQSAADEPSLTWGATVTDLTSVASLTFTRIDPRGQPQPTCIISSVAGPANLAIFRQIAQQAGGFAEFIPTVNSEFTVLPGQILKAFGNLANIAATFSILWRERALQQSELT